MLADVIESIAAQWADVLRYLTAGEQETLVACVQDFLAGTDEVARYEAAQRIVDHVAPALPADHAIRRVIAAEGTKFAVGELSWSPAMQLLSSRLESAGIAPMITGQAGIEPPASADPADILREAQESILAAPAVPEAYVRDRGVDPNAPGLLRLSGPRGEVQLPAFQFGPDGRPYPVVMQINLLLDAGDDPWGVADWWLGPNGWIDAIPAESLGHVDDQLLVAAARAVFQGG